MIPEAERAGAGMEAYRACRVPLSVPGTLEAWVIVLAAGNFGTYLPFRPRTLA